jgi:hypothetical protein
MALSYQLTDDAAACGLIAACSGATVLAGGGRAATIGGTPGTTEVTALVPAGTTRAVFAIEVTPEESVSWDAGNCEVRLNVTSGNMDLTISAIYICRVNSSCTSQETLGSETGLSLSTTGGISIDRTIAISAVASPGAGDKLYVVMVVTNSNSMLDRTIGVTPDGEIDTPWTEEAEPGEDLVRVLSEPLGLPEALMSSRSLTRMSSEGVGVLEVITPARTIVRMLQESLGLSETINHTLAELGEDIVRTINEAVSLVESVERSLGITRVVDNLVGLAESTISSVTGAIIRVVNETVLIIEQDFTGNLIRVVNETLAITESLLRSMQFVRIRSEVLGLSEVIAVSRAYARSVSETLNLGEQVSHLKAMSRSVLETLGIAETTHHVLEVVAEEIIRVISESVAITESVVRSLGISRVVSETITVGESVLRSIGVVRVVSETLNLGESVLRSLGIIRAHNEPLAITETITNIVTTVGEAIVRVISETLMAVESISRSRALVRVRNETIGLLETIIALGVVLGFWIVDSEGESLLWEDDSPTDVDWEG